MARSFDEYIESIGDQNLEPQLAKEGVALEPSGEAPRLGRWLVAAAETAYTTGREWRLGMLAARQARSEGAQVNGWRFKPGKSFDGRKDRNFRHFIIED